MPDPRRDTAGLSKLAKYLAKPRTIAEIRERFDLSERSAYRWMDYLKQDGTRVVIERVSGKITYTVEAAS